MRAMKLFKSHRAKGSAQPAPRRPAPETPARQQAEPGGARPKELGGPEGPEPTRYGDWERKGICYDF